jgi:hypothetical protein
MPVVSSIVAEDGAEQGTTGVKFMRFEFTDSTGTVHTHFGYRKYPIATDADTQRLALIPELNAKLVKQEQQAVWQAGIQGQDITNYPAVESTIADLLTYWWRRFMNTFSSAGDTLLTEQMEIAVSAAPYYNLPSSPQISGYIDDVTWTTQEVNTALNGIQAIAVNAAGLEHDNPEMVL